MKCGWNSPHGEPQVSSAEMKKGWLCPSVCCRSLAQVSAHQGMKKSLRDLGSLVLVLFLNGCFAEHAFCCSFHFLFCLNLFPFCLYIIFFFLSCVTSFLLAVCSLPLWCCGPLFFSSHLCFFAALLKVPGLCSCVLRFPWLTPSSCCFIPRLLHLLPAFSCYLPIIFSFLLLLMA